MDVLIDVPPYFVLPQSPSSIYATARLFYLSYSQRRGWAAELENKRIFLALEFPKPRFKYKIKTQHKTKLRKAQSVIYSVSLSLRLIKLSPGLEGGSEETQTLILDNLGRLTLCSPPLSFGLEVERASQVGSEESKSKDVLPPSA